MTTTTNGMCGLQLHAFRIGRECALFWEDCSQDHAPGWAGPLDSWALSELDIAAALEELSEAAGREVERAEVLEALEAGFADAMCEIEDREVERAADESRA